MQPTLQGSNALLQGSSINLQGSSPNLQPTVAPAVAQASAPSTSSSDNSTAGTASGANVTSTPSYIVGVNDPATIAGYTQAINDINQSLGTLPVQEQGAENQIGSNYNTAYQQLLGQLNAANSAYGTNTTDNQQNYVTNKNTIGTNAGQSLTGIERLLASRGAGGGSAATIVAPTAVGTAATQQDAGAGQAYGSTQSGLDQSIGAYREQNQNDQGSILNQEQSQDTAAQASINNTKAGLLQQLATLSAQKAAAEGSNPTAAAAPYLASANTALSAAANLGLQVAPLNYNTAAYTAPTAASYTPNPFSSPTTSNPSAGITNNNVAPSLTPLLKSTTALSGVPNTSATPASPTAGA